MTDDAEEFAPLNGKAQMFDGVVLKGRSDAVGVGEVSHLDGCSQMFFLRGSSLQKFVKCLRTFLCRKRVQRQIIARLPERI